MTTTGAPTRTTTAELRERHVGGMDNVSYLVTCRATGAQLLVDAAAEAPALLELVRAGNPAGRLDAVVTTHRHHDHVGALADVLSATGARSLAGAADAAHLPARVDRRLAHGDVVAVGALRLHVVHLRGHTAGSVALVLRTAGEAPHVWTGDSLFPGGVGNTGGDPARFTSLLDDVEERLFGPLPDEAVVHPGHGAPTTLGEQRPQLAAWRERGW
ncbi:MBL fold metallo-hydrolase [Kineococcus terrestris]|uniref:MBL fold metallo-hydrolase n=1 Tax=Kineococcus terrestris TaxID=2044856 RepID=UPI0034DB0442